MRIVVSGMAAFAVCMIVSSALYPGGTWSSRDATGYSFWHNYWCDLLDPHALNGAPNVAGSWVARAGFACMAIALLRFWPLAARVAGGGARAVAATRLGTAGALGLLALSVLPTLTSPAAHAVAVSLSAAAGLLAALFLIPWLSPRRDLAAWLLGAGLALTSSATLLQYVRQAVTQRDFAGWLPGMQKLATLFLFGWMLQNVMRLTRVGRQG
jgi:hypothetical protein